MAALLIGYARCSTDQQDLTAQRDGLAALGVAANRIYVGTTSITGCWSSAQTGVVVWSPGNEPSCRALGLLVSVRGLDRRLLGVPRGGQVLKVLTRWVVHRKGRDRQRALRFEVCQRWTRPTTRSRADELSLRERGAVFVPSQKSSSVHVHPIPEALTGSSPQPSEFLRLTLVGGCFRHLVSGVGGGRKRCRFR